MPRLVEYKLGLTFLGTPQIKKNAHSTEVEVGQATELEAGQATELEAGQATELEVGH